MENIEPFTSGFPLQDLPDIIGEVFFVYHPGINKITYLNVAFEKMWNISRNEVTSDLSLITNSVHPDDKEMVTNGFHAVQKN